MKPNLRSTIRAKHYWYFVATVSVFITLALTILGPKMVPAKIGKAKEFWRLAADAEPIATTIPSGGHAYYPGDGCVAYTLSHMHGSDLYRVPEADALAEFGAVKQRLLEASELGEDTPFVQGFHEWQSKEHGFQTPSDLFYAIRRAERVNWAKNDTYSLLISDHDESSFWRRWRHLKWYWANYVFEWMFLTGLALFIAWPGIRGKSLYRWAVHLGLAPLIFMVPTYLGYARFSFTSAGLSGGIVYPYLLNLTAGGRCNRWDRWLLEHLPQILEPLSAPIGEWLSISGRGMPGPTSVLELGILIAVAVVSIPRAWRWLLTKRAEARKLQAKREESRLGQPFSRH